VIISPERKQKLNDNLMFFFTGFTRLSSEIQKDTKKNTGKNIDTLLKMKEQVDIAEQILVSKDRDLDDFGRLLNESWRLKRSTGNKVSTEAIDEIYQKAMDAGALGGKLLGAGGGGFIVFYVPENRQADVKKALNNLLYVPFRFENTGTEVIYYSPEQFNVEGDYDD
jgi:D-glycero-alpha-D-manno-heptose-7-phosphate kinase